MKESMSISEQEMSENNLNEHFEEGFAAFKNWFQEQGVVRGTITMKRWGSGDASTTLHYATKDGGGGIALEKFAKGFEWYFQSKDVGDVHSTGLADELKDFLAEHDITIEKK